MISLRAKPLGTRHDAATERTTSAREPRLAVCGQAAASGARLRDQRHHSRGGRVAELFAKVYEAFLDYQLILFRDVDLPPATQVAFARNFGEVQVHVLSGTYGYRGQPEIYLLSNLDSDGNPSGKHPDKVRSSGTPTARGVSAPARRR